MTDEEKIAFEEGRSAATNLEAECPYEEGSAQEVSWRAGYAYADANGKAGKPND